MGQRINLAELADDDFLDEVEETPTPRAAAVDASTIGSGPEVPIETVALNPLNKRPPGEDDEIEALAETIRGKRLIQPLVVCSSSAFLDRFPGQKGVLGGAEWVALIGNRRLQAARKASLATVPVIVNDDEVASMYEVMLIENVQRRALPPLLEAEALHEALLEASISARELARRIGKSHVYVLQRLALRNLVTELRDAFEAGELKIELARQFGDLPEEEQRKIVAAGKPYRPLGGNAVTTSRVRSIRASTPAAAAKSIAEQFSSEELEELIRLLTEARQAVVVAD
ncbi:chromosome partitioning protein ParB [Prauserella sp. PE36]|uniref:ParB/RepB/Spo0J family partition protein n=1 Tax=Prauserella sp. PE36 TaxID=1504709 RepID=UPI000DE4EAF4|nr:ParB/RepB/Spo0J family partition protein [Prauserella sp. PE36]RBM18097.1 chromosome partitioning protein ParB [Prauserella sp. PE36]